MSLNAATLEILIAKGLSASDLLDVARAMESTKTKSKAAIRQARYRERKEAESVTNDVTCDVTNPPNDIYSNPHPSVTKVTLDHSVKRGREAKPFDVCPDGVDAAHWRDFLANRRAKRLPNTETAYRGVLRKLAKLTNDEWPPGRLMQAIVEKGWASIHDPRNEQEFQNGHVRQSGSQPKYKPSAAIALYQSSFEGDEPDSGHDWPALPASLGH